VDALAEPSDRDRPASSGVGSHPVAVVAGASSGIGAATASLLVERGWSVFGLARRRDRLEAMAGTRFVPVVVDLAEATGADAAMAQVLATEGRVDALVLSAGHSDAGPLELVPPAEMRRQFETNVFGTVRLVQLALPTMRAQGSGRVVSIDSLMARSPLPLLGPYSGTKAAMAAVLDAARMEVRRSGVHVVTVVPAAVSTDFDRVACERLADVVAASPSSYDDACTRMQRRLREARAGASSPEDVARVVVRAIEARRPRPRYYASTSARVLAIGSQALPTAVRDRVLRRAAGL
jgi:short-subunit dehydrogenase